MSRESRSLPPGWVCAALSRIVPWFLGRQDRETLRVVADDLREDAQVRMFRGASAAEARKWQRQHLWEETKLFVGRGVRRQGRVAASVGACAVVVVLGAFFVSELWGAPNRIVELRERLEKSLALAGTGEATQPNSRILIELAGFEQSITQELADTPADHTDHARLLGLLAGAIEGQADFWEAYGVGSTAEARRAEAWQTYLRAADGGDPVSQSSVGVRLADREGYGRAVPYLRQAYASMPGLGLDSTPWRDEFTHLLHYSLIELFKQEGPQSLVLVHEAWEIEKRAFEAYNAGVTSPFLHLVAYNGACVRILLVNQGLLEPSEGLVAIDYLQTALATAGPEVVSTAVSILDDPDLDSIRDHPAFEALLAHARRVASSADTDRAR